MVLNAILKYRLVVFRMLRGCEAACMLVCLGLYNRSKEKKTISRTSSQSEVSEIY